MATETLNIISIVVAVVSILGNVTMVVAFGPVRAARLTRELQREGALRDRKMDVFRRLSATRGFRLNPDHVWALNLIPIEFNGISAVITAWRTYLEHTNFPIPPDQAQQNAFFHEREKRLMGLIEAIAADVGIAFDRMDIQDYSYVPQAWNDDEHDQRRLRKLGLDVLMGLRALHVTPMTAPASPFPPPPTPQAAPPALPLSSSTTPS
jgi:hypothetical protein